ncbi:DUF2321 domain-containing protein [Erysipelothrix rhusiopathiae]|nr:DUF2321 domain-containing protein [Erysipelothrix rhusiopathiae]MDE9420603.1 DUF2321 domain-containing protein [Erysipelothrix rhusiopathiae]
MGIYNDDYWSAKICINGHIVDYGNGEKDLFCNKCGSEVIKNCKSCNAKIRGSKRRISAIAGDYVSYFSAKLEDMVLPYYCQKCGTPYEWTQEILNNAVELLSLEDSISQEHKDLIRAAIPDLIVDTPKTPVAIAKFNKGFSKLSKPIKDGMYQLLVDVLSASIKQQLFPTD